MEILEKSLNRLNLEEGKTFFKESNFQEGFKGS